MLDTSDPENNGFINEDFIVWMRTAALPTFRKLYRLIERKDNLRPTLPAGNYSLEIAYSILSLNVLKAQNGPEFLIKFDFLQKATRQDLQVN